MDQRDALLAAGVDARHLFEYRASGGRDGRAGLAKALTKNVRFVSSLVLA
jgi:hypothetical protein